MARRLGSEERGEWLVLSSLSAGGGEGFFVGSSVAGAS